MRSGLFLPLFDALADPQPYRAAGATWWMVEFPPDAVSVDAVRGVIREGPLP